MIVAGFRQRIRVREFALFRRRMVSLGMNPDPEEAGWPNSPSGNISPQSVEVQLRIFRKNLINNAIRIRNGTTKNDEGCWKPIPPDMASYLRALPPQRLWIFYRVENEAFRPLGDFRKAWMRCLSQAGISNFRFHDTRHISATNLLDNGTPEQVVQAVAGWKTNMLRTYYHLSGKKSLSFIRFRSVSGHLRGRSERNLLESCRKQQVREAREGLIAQRSQVQILTPLPKLGPLSCWFS